MDPIRLTPSKRSNANFSSDDGTASQLQQATRPPFHLTFLISRETPIPLRASRLPTALSKPRTHLRGGNSRPARASGETPPGNTLRARSRDVKRAASVAHLPAASPKVNRGGARRVVGANASTAPVLVASEKRCRASSRTARRAVAAVRCASLPSFISSTCVWSRPSMMLALRRTRVPGTRPRSVRSFPPLSNRRARPLTSPLALLFLCPRAAGYARRRARVHEFRIFQL